MDASLGVPFTKLKHVARAPFAASRQIGYAVAILSLFVTPLSYGVGSKDPTVVHLDGAETITGVKTDTTSWFFSNPSSTLMLGSPSIPPLWPVLPGAQQLILTTGSNRNWPFAVIGDFRNGVSGARYYSGFTPDGHFSSNMYLGLTGNGNGASENGGSMLSMWADVPVALSISNGAANDAQGGLLISAWGNVVQHAWPRVFAVSSQGTTTISNPYGEAIYTRPQFVLGDIGVSAATPAWNYSSFHQHNGHLIIGTFDNGNAEGGELDVSSGQVAVDGNLVVAPHTPASSTDAGVAGTVTWDSNYVYICVAPNTWKRAALTSW